MHKRKCATRMHRSLASFGNCSAQDHGKWQNLMDTILCITQCSPSLPHQLHLYLTLPWENSWRSQEPLAHVIPSSLLPRQAEDTNAWKHVPPDTKIASSPLLSDPWSEERSWPKTSPVHVFQKCCLTCWVFHMLRMQSLLWPLHFFFICTFSVVVPLDRYLI